MNKSEAKLLAARAAIDYLPDGGVIGLGSGSTARMFIEELGKLVGAGRDYRGVPTSAASRAQAESLGIPLLDDAGPWPIDVCVDGADEVSDRLDLIKGGGGAHTREKIVNHSSAKNVIIVDESKLSRLLGEKWPVPVEILAFGHRGTRAALERFGRVEVRRIDGAPWESDSGNLLVDVHTGTIEDPAALESRLRRVPGVVDTGLFVGRASVVIVAGTSGIRRLEPG